MSMRRRIAALAWSMQADKEDQVLINWPGRGPDLCRKRVEDAQSRGCTLKIVRFSIVRVADTVEEAEAVLAQHQVDRPQTPVTVYSRRNPGTEVLAEWAPDLPEWLQEADDS